ncbi:hypothetical protein DV737_g3057, partial [Chaetothyriales sp. CBS 132003]
MGNDGGSIPTRRELVKEAARNPTATALKEKLREHLAHRWSQCPVSHTALAKPVVSDYAGDLYNKDAIIQFLLPDQVSPIDKAEYGKFIQGRITSLKDVVEVIFETEHDSVAKTDRWICPITSKVLGPAVKAVYIVPCGHAFSHEAIKEMQAEQCSQCGASYQSRDIIPILPSTEAEKTQLQERIASIWGTENPPGLADPYGGPSFLERHWAQREQRYREKDEALAGREAADYKPATTWDGLMHIGHAGHWRDIAPTEHDTYQPWFVNYDNNDSNDGGPSTFLRATTREDAELLFRDAADRAGVELFATVEQEDLASQPLDLTNPATFQMIKSFRALTGFAFADSFLSSLARLRLDAAANGPTYADLITHYIDATTKAPQTTVYESLAAKHELAAQPNSAGGR